MSLGIFPLLPEVTVLVPKCALEVLPRVGLVVLGLIEADTQLTELVGAHHVQVTRDRKHSRMRRATRDLFDDYIEATALGDFVEFLWLALLQAILKLKAELTMLVIAPDKDLSVGSLLCFLLLALRLCVCAL